MPVCSIVKIITQPSIYGVIVYFCYLMSHQTFAQAIFFILTDTIPWSGFPLRCQKQPGAYEHTRRRCAYGLTLVKMRHDLATLNSNNFVVYGQKHIVGSPYLEKNV